MTKSSNIASIDIGTNSVLLTVVSMPSMTPIVQKARITRLGEGLSLSGKFSDEAIGRTFTVLEEYADICAAHDVQRTIAVGTAAMRRSKNSAELIRKAKEELGIEIEVISGEREAELAFKASARDFGEKIIVLDIGGGSTELVSTSLGGDNPSPQGGEGKGEGGTFWQSLPLGCVTLHEENVLNDSVTDEELSSIKRSIDRAFKEAETGGFASKIKDGYKLIATAGTATTLSAMKLGLTEYKHSDVHGSRLTLGDIEATIDILASITVAERTHIPGLESKRADVILPGAMILKAVMENLGASEVTVSDRGVRWGLIYEAVSVIPA